mgnify:CR=1 FL=1
MANAHQETLVDFKAVQFGSVLGMVQNIGSIPILFTNSQASSLFGGACLVFRPLSPNNTNGLRFVSLIYEVNI